MVFTNCMTSQRMSFFSNVTEKADRSVFKPGGGEANVNTNDINDGNAMRIVQNTPIL